MNKGKAVNKVIVKDKIRALSRMLRLQIAPWTAASALQIAPWTAASALKK